MLELIDKYTIQDNRNIFERLSQLPNSEEFFLPYNKPHFAYRLVKEWKKAMEMFIPFSDVPLTKETNELIYKFYKILKNANPNLTMGDYFANLPYHLLHFVKQLPEGTFDDMKLKLKNFVKYMDVIIPREELNAIKEEIDKKLKSLEQITLEDVSKVWSEYSQKIQQLIAHKIGAEKTPYNWDYFLSLFDDNTFKFLKVLEQTGGEVIFTPEIDLMFKVLDDTPFAEPVSRIFNEVMHFDNFAVMRTEVYGPADISAVVGEILDKHFRLRKKLTDLLSQYKDLDVDISKVWEYLENPEGEYDEVTRKLGVFVSNLRDVMKNVYGVDIRKIQEDNLREYISRVITDYLNESVLKALEPVRVITTLRVPLQEAQRLIEEIPEEFRDKVKRQIEQGLQMVEVNTYAPLVIHVPKRDPEGITYQMHHYLRDYRSLSRYDYKVHPLAYDLLEHLEPLKPNWFERVNRFLKQLAMIRPIIHFYNIVTRSIPFFAQILQDKDKLHMVVPLTFEMGKLYTEQLFSFFKAVPLLKHLAEGNPYDVYKSLKENIGWSKGLWKLILDDNKLTDENISKLYRQAMEHANLPNGVFSMVFNPREFELINLFMYHEAEKLQKGLELSPIEKFLTSLSLTSAIMWFRASEIQAVMYHMTNKVLQDEAFPFIKASAYEYVRNKVKSLLYWEWRERLVNFYGISPTQVSIIFHEPERAKISRKLGISALELSNEIKQQFKIVDEELNDFVIDKIVEGDGDILHYIRTKYKKRGEWKKAFMATVLGDEYQDPFSAVYVDRQFILHAIHDYTSHIAGKITDYMMGLESSFNVPRRYLRFWSNILFAPSWQSSHLRAIRSTFLAFKGLATLLYDKIPEGRFKRWVEKLGIVYPANVLEFQLPTLAGARLPVADSLTSHEEILLGTLGLDALRRGMLAWWYLSKALSTIMTGESAASLYSKGLNPDVMGVPLGTEEDERQWIIKTPPYYHDYLMILEAFGEGIYTKNPLVTGYRLYEYASNKLAGLPRMILRTILTAQSLREGGIDYENVMSRRYDMFLRMTQSPNPVIKAVGQLGLETTEKNLPSSWAVAWGVGIAHEVTRYLMGVAQVTVLPAALKGLADIIRLGDEPNGFYLSNWFTLQPNDINHPYNQLLFDLGILPSYTLKHIRPSWIYGEPWFQYYRRYLVLHKLRVRQTLRDRLNDWVTEPLVR